MRTLFGIALLAAVLAGCGEKKAETPPAPTPTATSPAPEASVDLTEYSPGVRDYYGDSLPAPSGDEESDIELEYHQPPKPAEAGLGEPITLTGTNIGVRMRVTVTKVEQVGKYTAVRLRLESTGIAVYEAPLQNATLTYAGGRPVPVAKGARAGCSRDFDAQLRIDVGATRTGCVLFPAGGSKQPERFQLALEIVPAVAGGIWNLG